MVKKVNFVLFLLLAAALVLSGCGGGQESSATEPADLMLTETVPGTGPTLDTDSTPAIVQGEPTLDAQTTPVDAATNAPLDGQTTPLPAETSAPTGAAATAPSGETMTTPAQTQAAGAGDASATGTSFPTPASAGELSGTQTVTDTLRGAEILPEGGRRQLILLSNWDDFAVVDQNEQPIGQVQDYLINMCEAHILYMVVQPEAGGAEMLIPYEAVSVNGGSINADARTITLALDADQAAAAPTLAQRPALDGVDWEGDVRDYWGGIVSLSSLDTSCSVAASGTQDATAVEGGQEGTDVNKLAYAGAIRGAVLQDENQTVLGQVQDAVLEPESGQIFFLAVEVEGGNGGIVLVPIGAVNVPANAHAQQGSLNLVFLKDAEVLTNAPTIDSLDALTTNVDQAAYDYWNPFVPMGPGPTSP